MLFLFRVHIYISIPMKATPCILYINIFTWIIFCHITVRESHHVIIWYCKISFSVFFRLSRNKMHCICGGNAVLWVFTQLLLYSFKTSQMFVTYFYVYVFDIFSDEAVWKYICTHSYFSWSVSLLLSFLKTNQACTLRIIWF